jgi:hypothetical protein
MGIPTSVGLPINSSSNKPDTFDINIAEKNVKIIDIRIKT